MNEEETEQEPRPGKGPTNPPLLSLTVLDVTASKVAKNGDTLDANMAEWSSAGTPICRHT